ncbi:NAD(P)-binding protein [Dendrothele bispora CBS 962.96]|uniref:NAD(P)-binding protein n=1 Tax=Dendrothele bispora (strain CBS 962.96) TaxID=1314807 RepID=A0A4S8MNK8_DENBC|nr:NAD(P)-binding protein [Dendrothele bispora CBS 962.96]
MPSYAVAGASRGIGLQFVAELLARGNVVIALARNPENSEGLQSLKDNKTLHIIKADITDLVALKNAAEETAKATGGSLDVLINNGVYQNKAHLYNTLVDFPSTEELISDLTNSFQTNVLGPILTTNAFLPLLRKGTLKKVITLNTGLADVDLTSKCEYPKITSYSISKAALEMVNVKYALALKDEGFSFLNISPGFVNTAQTAPSEEEMKEIMVMLGAFKKAYPDWTPVPVSPAESVCTMLGIIDNLTVEQSGKFVSHKNNREWL